MGWFSRRKSNDVEPKPAATSAGEPTWVTQPPGPPGYDTWVLTVGDDMSDLDDDFDVEGLKRRIARARKGGGRVRIKWDEDWSETYDITPDLLIELYCDRADGTTSETEILNGPGAPE